MQAKLGEAPFVVIEKWASMEMWQVHARSEHMAAYGARVADMLAGRIIHMLVKA